jgi:asparagine synthase (glutamine-hydrolysing)/putative beta-lactam synthetase
MTMAVGLEMRLPFCDHELLEYVWNVPWSMKTDGGVKGLLKAAMADILPESTVNRKKSAYPHIQNPLYDETILRDAERILGDKLSPAAFMFDNTKLTKRIRQIRSGDASVNAAHMFIQLIETDQWMRDYNVASG